MSLIIKSLRAVLMTAKKSILKRTKINLKKNIVLLIIMFKSSIQREQDRFFKSVSQSDYNIREVLTKGAFPQARAKLNPCAFKRLNEVTVDTFYQGAEYYV